MKIISDINQINLIAWREFVYNHPEGNIFQTPEMYSVYLETINYEPVVLLSIKEEKILGLLLAVIQKESKGLAGKFSARSIIFGGPLVLDNNNEVVDALISGYNKIIKKKAIYSQLRNFWPTDEQKEIMEANGFTFQEHLNILIDTNLLADKVFSRFSQDRRWEIRKAYKQNVFIEEVNSQEKLAVFYSFIKSVYRRINLPYPDISLITSVYNNLVKNGLGKFYLIGVGDKYLGSHSILLYKNKILCWYGGFDRNYSKYFPYEVLIWESMKWGSENGYTMFDFQGAGKPGQEYGVRDFKMRFGGTLVNWGRYEKHHQFLLYHTARLGFKGWQLTRRFFRK